MIPETRSEQYLASIIGEEVELPVPQSRIEHYLNIIAQNGVAPSSAGLINYDPDASYPDGSIGKEVHDLDGDVSELKSAISDLPNTYAKQDGSYDTMTVGNAKQLVATVGVEDSVPYTFRTSGGSADIGDRETDMVVGGTIAWNQLVRSASVGVVNGTLTYDQNTNTHAFIAAGTDSRIFNNYAKTLNHVYLTIATVTSSVSGTLKNEISYGWANKQVSITADTPLAFSSILKVASGVEPSPARSPQFFILNMSSYTLSIKDWMFFDLTQMFGSTIADYIYSLEQANAGAGVAFFRKLFPKPYYEYNAGELLSVNASAHKMVGFNQASEVYNGFSTQYTRCLYAKVQLMPDTVYCISFVDAPGHKFYFSEDLFATSATPWATVTATGARQSILVKTKPNINTNNAAQYDSNKGWALLKNGAGNTVAPDFTEVCINLSWSGSRNGEYEPYVEHTYPLDSSLMLRGIPKLSADNTLYYDGDTYESDGTVTRKYGIRVLNGTEDWHSPDSSGHCWCQDDSIKRSNKAGVPYSETMISTVKVANNSYNIGTVTEPVVTAWGGTTASDDNYWYFAAPNVEDTPTAIKEYLAANPVTIVYMLTTPTTESANPYQTPQIVDDFGTEEYIVTEQSGVAVPVGHVTTYPANLRDKLQHLPDLADADGYYMIQQTNNDMSLIRFRIPQAPTTDGEYILKATVSGGTPTYTWEAQT